MNENNYPFTKDGNQKLFQFFEQIRGCEVQFTLLSEKVLKIQSYFQGEKNKAALVEFLYPVSKSYSVYSIQINSKIKGTFDYPENPERLLKLFLFIKNHYSNQDHLILIGNEKNGEATNLDYDILIDLFDIVYFDLE